MLQPKLGPSPLFSLKRLTPRLWAASQLQAYLPLIFVGPMYRKVQSGWLWMPGRALFHGLVTGICRLLDNSLIMIFKKKWIILYTWPTTGLLLTKILFNQELIAPLIVKARVIKSTHDGLRNHYTHHFKNTIKIMLVIFRNAILQKIKRLQSFFPGKLRF